jgi:anti-anti-sigma factor
VTDSQTAAGLVIRIKGEVRRDGADALMDSLLAPAARRPAIVTLDLRQLRFLSCLATGVLVSYCRGVVRTGGRVRLAEGLQPAVKEALIRLGLFNLLETTAEGGLAPNRQECSLLAS